MTILANVQGLHNLENNPRANADFTEILWTLRHATTRYGLAARDDLGWLIEEIRDHCGPVMAELAAFRAHDPIDRVRRAFLFAIISPQCVFAENVIAVTQCMERFDELHQPGVAFDCLTVPYHGDGNPRLVSLGKTKAERIRQCAGWLRNQTPETFTYETVKAISGMGDKTTAMALHLVDETAEVFTLDQWMLRLTSALGGGDPRITIKTTSAGYKLTEGDWLAWCARFLPDLSPFTVQWTLWNLCFGRHVSHLGILGV